MPSNRTRAGTAPAMVVAQRRHIDGGCELIRLARVVTGRRAPVRAGFAMVLGRSGHLVIGPAAGMRDVLAPTG